MTNPEIKEMLKNAAYVLISSFTAREAFLDMVDEIDENSDISLVDSFATESEKVRADELKKLQDKIAAVQRRR